MAKGKYQEWLTKEGLLLIEGWARDGLTDEQIAKNMGIAVKTLYNWKNSHMPILQALKKGKEVVDREVENALLKRALGYQYEEVTYEMGVEVKRVCKEVTPDTTALIFWLKNRMSDWGGDRAKRVSELRKLEADTQLVQERIKLLKGATKDTSLLDALINAVKGDD
ncbi:MULTISPECIES: hypothetical protein [Ectobacillus]|uniref:hypothetical protein n=1 Tax=Ectobacillus TaxID=2837502 RepID=UPI001FE99013|nr:MULTISPECIES: hypothetical protein [Ectobacillus]UOY92888.1 hypothetical protein MUG87_01720 [Ectobacillus sp. JY-23]